MDATNRAMMNVSGLDILGFMGKVARVVGSLVFRAAMGTVNGIRAWNQAQKGRRALLSMSDHMLKDLGISRVDAIQYSKGKSRV